MVGSTARRLAGQEGDSQLVVEGVSKRSGRVLLEGKDITQKKPSDIAALGIARTFQNIALFSGLTVLDNLMLGRHVRMKAGVLSSVLYWGLAQREEIRHRQGC